LGQRGEEGDVSTFRVGAQFHPQQTTVEDLRAGWRAADELGVDSIWTWDHFYPLYGDPDGAHLEGWSLLAAIACDTRHAEFGAMVTCNSYRNPDLLADMARTVDHLSGGRLILGIGAGWFHRDYEEYGYDFGTAADRLRALEAALPRIRTRLERLNPPPVRDPMPILIGGGGEKVTLRLVAEYADLWNGFGPPERYARKNRVIDEWCERVRRDPAAIERTVLIESHEVDQLDAFLEAGAQHVIVELGTKDGRPFDLDPVRTLLERRG
jgi:probable F420-dependent oxidoreductase